MSIGTQNFEMAAENYYNIIHLQRKYIQYTSNDDNNAAKLKTVELLE